MSKAETDTELKRIEKNQDSNERDADKVTLDPILEGEGGYYFLSFPV